ncbi:MAG: helix-turn-helix transcriptional regulator [Flavobacteriales bacterium]|nr:helix-turn-helix transcriptional regulator [Flavobacteriales bacterium]
MNQFKYSKLAQMGFIRSVATRVFPDICSMLNSVVGKNLRLLRIMNDFSQEDVEIGVDVSRSTLSKIENGTGKIALDRLERFAKFFKVEVITILMMAENRESYKLGQPIPTVNDVQSDYRKTDVELARSQEKVGSLKKEVSYLKQELVVSKSQIKDKDHIIQLLSNK